MIDEILFQLRTCLSHNGIRSLGIVSFLLAKVKAYRLLSIGVPSDCLVVCGADVGDAIPASSSTFRISEIRNKPTLWMWSLLSAVLIAINWLVFVRCVQINAVIESSLGYFITPLMSVALGVGVLGERLRPIQWLAVGLAGVGVGYIAVIGIHSIPRSDTRMFIRDLRDRQETAPIAAIPGLWLETAILVATALIYLSIASMDQQGAGRTVSAGDRSVDDKFRTDHHASIVAFAIGTPRIPLSQLGLLQYIAPSIQFFVGWIGLHEPVSFDRWIGFGFVWLGLLIYTISSQRVRMRVRD